MIYKWPQKRHASIRMCMLNTSICSLILAPIMHYSVYVHDGELSVSDI